MARRGCEHLAEWADDPDVPVARGPAGGYVLTLSGDCQVPDMACLFCGGRGWPRPDHRPCRCGASNELARLAPARVRYDPAVREYQLIAGRSYLILNYCPACGGRLPPSRRWAGARTEDLSAEVAELASGLGSLAEVAARFGLPDETGVIGAEESGAMRKHPALTYRSIRPGAEVTFYEPGQGRVTFLVCGHARASALDAAGFRWRGNW